MPRDIVINAPAPRAKADPRALREGHLLFVGNATVLLRLAGFTILTDPNFVFHDEEVPIGYGMSARRLTDPAFPIDALPHLDLIILSHFHGDHFDQVAQARLRRSIPVVTTGEAAGKLHDLGFTDLRPLETWEQARFESPRGRLTVTATPGRHAPAAVAFALPDVMGSILEFDAAEPAPRIYISGDTLMYEDIEEIPRRYPEIDYGLPHLGGTRVMGVTVTMDAEQGVRWLQAVNPRRAIPIHYDDYDLFESPVGDFEALAGRAGFGDRLIVPERGEVIPL